MSFVLPDKRPLIMGIINVTPDSFSGDGMLVHKEYVAAATEQAARMAAEGADIIDIGGESSRPGAVPISIEEEMRRVVPVIASIRKNLDSKQPLAVDTVKANVAEAALDAGADIINDISALKKDPAMAALAARRGCHVILMHNRSDARAVTQDVSIGGQYEAPLYDNIVEDVRRDLEDHAKIALQAGIAKRKIILDPGLGFGKTVAQNFVLIRHVERIKDLGYPVLLGPSRKSFVGKALNKPIGERLEGTAALVTIAAFLGTDILRVHDVKFMAEAVRIAAAVKNC
jgi:dihydropteroate synthase